jgi:hypothetical protein
MEVKKAEVRTLNDELRTQKGGGEPLSGFNLHRSNFSIQVLLS